MLRFMGSQRVSARWLILYYPWPMGEHRVMELLLQFITGGGINSGTIRGSASQLWCGISPLQGASCPTPGSASILGPRPDCHLSCRPWQIFALRPRPHVMLQMHCVTCLTLSPWRVQA